MLKLAVVTHSRFDRPQLMQQTIESVRAQMPVGGTHFLLECRNREQFESARWQALQLAEYVAFVDDDDLVIGDSLQLCMQALDENPDAGVAFTNQQLIDLNGQIIEDPRHYQPDDVLFYRRIPEMPQLIHHLAMVRTSKVDPHCLSVSQSLGGIGVEWLLKGSAALDHGAVHVPMYGYQWRQHGEAAHSTEWWSSLYNDNINSLMSFLMCRADREGPIPRYQHQ